MKQRETYHHLPVTESLDAAMARIATHICQYTKRGISPAVCDKRKGIRGNPMSDMGHNPFWMCAECPGAEEKEKPKVESTYHCKDCDQDKPIGEFYQSNKSLCKSCMSIRAKERKEAKTITAVPAITIEEPIEESTTPPKTCTKCGSEFEDYLNGCIHPSVCPDCLNASKKAGAANREKSNRSALTLTFSTDRDEALLQRLQEVAELERRDLASQALTILERELMGGVA